MRATLVGFTAVVLLFLVLPVLVILPISFTSGSVLSLPIPGVSWRWYEDFFTGERWLRSTANSVLVATSAALLATVLGTCAACGLHFGAVRRRALLVGVLSLPLAVPSVIAGLAIYLGFARVGLTNTMAGLVLAHTLLTLPFVVLPVLAALERFDPVLLRAAASLGASPARAAWWVLVPAIAPGVGAAAVFAFAISFDEVIVALFIAGPAQFTLPRQMLAGVREFLSPTICAAAVVLTAVSLGLMGLGARALSPADTASATPRRRGVSARFVRPLDTG